MTFSAEEFNRRSFLHQAALVAGGLAAAGLIRIPAFITLTADSPIASTRSGKVRGYVDNGINVFKGIRYGADTAKRRFMPPLPPDPWSDLHEALAYGPSAPQPSRSNDKPSEDCLFLNIWTPAL